MLGEAALVAGPSTSALALLGRGPGKGLMAEEVL